MYATINGTRIFYDVDGKQVVYDETNGCMKEKPVCFILHGGPGGDHNIYGDNFHWLSEYMQLVYIDYRGNGRSERGDKSLYTIEQYVEDIEALRRYLGLEKVVVMGQSFGGIMSQAYAIKYPEYVAAVILIATAPSCETMANASQQLAERGTPEMLAYFNEVMRKGTFQNDDDLYEYLTKFAPLYTLYGAEKYRKEVGNCILSHEASNVGLIDINTYNFLDELHKIICPTLIMGGEQDFIATIDQTHKIAERVKDCEVVVIPDSSHEVFLDQPEKSKAAIDLFVRERVVTLTKYCR